MNRTIDEGINIHVSSLPSLLFFSPLSYVHALSRARTTGGASFLSAVASMRGFMIFLSTSLQSSLLKAMNKY